MTEKKNKQVHRYISIFKLSFNLWMEQDEISLQHQAWENTDHTQNEHMQRSHTYRDVCLSFGAKYTTELNGAEDYEQKETSNTGNCLWAEKEDAVREKEPKKKGQNGHDDWSVLEHLTC